jgi:serine/threonine-protein kinase HipA
MIDDKRSLIVYFEGVNVGLLETTNGVWSFEYHHAWISHKKSFPLSPFIALSNNKYIDDSTKRHVQWFFDNLLPEESARNLLADSAQIDKEDAFGILEYYGSESAGALTLLNTEKQWPKGSIEPLSKEKLSHRISNLATSPLNHDSQKKMSLAGAQHKLPIILANDHIFEPVGSMPSSHILKPEHERPNYFWATVCNEWFVMTLAKNLKLAIPDVKIIHVPQPVYIIKRFDRINEYPDQKRRHVIDACQLLGINPGAKYRQNDVNALVELIGKTRTKAKTRLRLFQWILFNALIGNNDSHLKNLSFYSQSGGYALCEHYDLLSTIIYNEDALGSVLSQPIGNAKLYNQLTPSDLYSFGQVIGLNQSLIAKEILKLTKNILKEFDALYEHVESWKIRPSKGGDLHMLREIKFKVLKPMLEQLEAG